MIGVFDYTVILTFCSLVSSIIGMTRALDGHFRIAVFCLALSGLFDTFDGMVARTKKNRSDHEKLYGIQLDSLADVVCFGVFPIMICYMMGVRGVPGVAAGCFYAVCGVIRLGWFNTLETRRQMNPDEGEKVFHGLPITSIAIILPMVFLLSFFLPEQVFHWLLFAMLWVVGLLFIVDFRMRKPGNRMIAFLIILTGLAVLTVVLFARNRVRPPQEPETPLIDEIDGLLEEYE